MSEWFDRAFGPWYWKLYAHRDEDEAGRALALVEPHLGEGPVLDVGCGGGRHLALLAARGRTAVGLDRSGFLLGEAARSGVPVDRLIRADMRRIPFADARFGSVLSMFTSFGYFPRREDHRRLLTEWRRVAVAGGRLVLDYLNEPRIRASLVPRSRREVDDVLVEERRAIDDDGELPRVVKELVIRDRDGRPCERYEESVALFPPAALHALLEEAGWRPTLRFGDYDGNAWSPGSPRLIVVAAAGGGR